MEYTNIVLFGLGIFGILLHNLVKLNGINRRNKGDVNYIQYIKLEKFTILISISVVFISLLIKHEVKQIETVDTWLGVSYVTIGYMAQSILCSVMNKAEKFIEEKSQD